MVRNRGGATLFILLPGGAALDFEQPFLFNNVSIVSVVPSRANAGQSTEVVVHGGFSPTRELRCLHPQPAYTLNPKPSYTLNLRPKPPYTRNPKHPTP